MRNRKSEIFNKLYHKAHSGSRFWSMWYTLYTQFVLGCDIKASTKIGDGFEIFHSAHGTVVSPGTIIGKNVSLRQNTTIGAKGFSGADNSPVIEDNVTIGPNVCIIGNITIGKGAIIGAGAVVVKDVKPNTVVAGNPAKELNTSVLGGKQKLRKLLIIKWLNKARRKYNRYVADRRRSPYISQIGRMISNNTSIISSNCFAGRVMQDLGMEYNSPTLGLYFWAEDYIEFLSNLKYYLTEANIEFVEHSKHALGNKRRANWEHWYPIGCLGGKVEIHFLHYHTEEEAAEKWYRRASRINWDKLLVLGFEQNLCSEKQILQFDNLPFVNKFFFSSKDIPECKSNIYMPEFNKKGEVGDPYLKGYLFYKYLIDNLNKQTE